MRGSAASAAESAKVLLLAACASSWKFHTSPKRDESGTVKSSELSSLSADIPYTVVFTAEEHVASFYEKLKTRIGKALHEVMMGIVAVLLAPCLLFLVAHHAAGANTKAEGEEATEENASYRKRSILRELADQVPEDLEEPLGTWLAERLPEGLSFHSALPTGPQVALSSAGREACSYDELKVLFQTTDVAYEFGLGPMPRIGFLPGEDFTTFRLVITKPHENAKTKGKRVRSKCPEPPRPVHAERTPPCSGRPCADAAGAHTKCAACGESFWVLSATSDKHIEADIEQLFHTYMHGGSKSSACCVSSPTAAVRSSGLLHPAGSQLQGGGTRSRLGLLADSGAEGVVSRHV